MGVALSNPLSGVAPKSKGAKKIHYRAKGRIIAQALCGAGHLVELTKDRANVTCKDCQDRLNMVKTIEGGAR